MKSYSTSTARPAFTLIEILVVLAIVAMLMALLFPVTNAVMQRARKTQAITDLNNVVTGIQNYYQEYGRYPEIIEQTEESVGQDTQILSEEDQGKLMAVLLADVRGPYPDLVRAENPRLIPFVSVKDAKRNQKRNGLDTTEEGLRAFWDPWGQLYQFSYDSNYDNVLGIDPDLPYPHIDYLRNQVVGWTPGENGDIEDPRDGKIDDVLSWE